MEMILVESSNVQAIGYSPGPDGKPGNCYVDFGPSKRSGVNSGARYCYVDVPAEIRQQFLDAPSKGACCGTPTSTSKPSDEARPITGSEAGQQKRLQERARGSVPGGVALAAPYQIRFWTM